MLPNKLKIRYYKEGFTNYIGIIDEKYQFILMISATLKTCQGAVDPELLYRSKRWYCILFLFDLDGRLLESHIKYMGTSANEVETLEKAKQYRERILNKYTNICFCDIDIFKFRIVFNDDIFGFQDDLDKQTITLMPADLVFFEPWQGEYDS